MAEESPTSFQDIYDFFLAGITDDMYMEMTEEDTKEVLQELLVAAINSFEFPHWETPFILDFNNQSFYYFLPFFNPEQKKKIGEKITKFNGVNT